MNFTVAQAPTATSVTSSASSIYNGSLYLQAQIATSVPSNSFFVTGTVTFTDTTSNTVLGVGYPSSGNQCPASTTLCIVTSLQVNSLQLAAGANNVTATYSGDSNFLGSGPSAPVVVTCVAGCANALGQSLSLAFYASSTNTITPGGSSTTPVDVTPGGGFTGAVNLTCTVTGKSSGDQHIPTCSFGPAQVNITNDQAVSSTLTISTTAPVTSALRYPPFGNAKPGMWLETGGTALATLLLLGFAPRRFRRRYLVALFGVVLAMGWMSACGGGGSGGGGGGGGGTTIPGTTADTYTVTFHAADAATGTVTAQDYFNFTVN